MIIKLLPLFRLGVGNPPWGRGGEKEDLKYEFSVYVDTGHLCFKQSKSAINTLTRSNYFMKKRVL